MLFIELLSVRLCLCSILMLCMKLNVCVWFIFLMNEVVEKLIFVCEVCLLMIGWLNLIEKFILKFLNGLKLVYLLFFCIFIGFLMWMKCLVIGCFLMLVDCSRNMNGLVLLFMIGIFGVDRLI